MHAWEIIIGIYANLDTLNPGFWLISDPQFSIIISLSLSFFFTQSLLHQNKETNLNGEQRNGFK